MGNTIDKSGALGFSTQRHEGTKKSNNKKSMADDEPKYSQNPEFLGRAFSLFCKGMSLPKVADALRPEWPDVNERTVQRIAQDNGWEKSRASYLKLHSDAAASAEGLVPEIITQLQSLRTKMESKAHLSAPEIFAYRSICEDLLWYTGKHPKLKDATPLAVSGDVEVAALLEAIAEDDVVGGAWKRRRSHIEKAYREKLDKATNSTQRHEGTKKSRSKKSGETQG